MNHETWKPVVGEPYCEVSSHGRVRYQERTITYKDGRSYVKQGAVLRCSVKQGYPAVELKVRGRTCVHTLVAESFIGKRPANARTVNHLDGNKSNNNYKNLEWASYAENNRHARLTRLNRAHGERCGLTKFSDDIVDAIRLLWPTKRFTQKELANLFNMSEGHVYEIVSGKSRSRPTDNT